ncbi:MAG TPA: PP2C family serine/threonine-protein phosphatase [Quisquiliibacterium sp.]|nr:PP2C family serine/threonine-protein phosphatase [Quisquiliibacterium sp.]
MQAVQTPQPPLHVAGCVAQHRGDRAEQQDRVAVLSSPIAARCVLGVLADGVGGRSGATHAAESVIDVSRRRFARFDPARQSAREFFEHLVRELHDLLHDDGAMAGLEPHSTLAAVLLEPTRAAWCHVGDSRVYRLRPGCPPLHTNDHRYERMLVEEAGLAPERARRHPHAGRLVHCLGAAHRPRPAIGSIDHIAADDCFVLCSDGLWEHMADEEIAGVARSLPPREAVESMIGIARSRGRGTGDNCSVALLRVDAARAGAPALRSSPQAPFSGHRGTRGTASRPAG